MHLIIFFALCAAFCGRVVAQDEVTVGEANRIFVTAGSPEKFVKFSATVIQSVPQEHYVFVQDGRAGTMVILPKDMPVPALRDRIEVEAKVKFVGASGDTTVWATAVRGLGRVELPESMRVKLEEIRLGRANRQSAKSPAPASASSS